MKEEDLNNKKQEWFTPKISHMGVEDTEGKTTTELERTGPYGTPYGPS